MFMNTDMYILNPRERVWFTYSLTHMQQNTKKTPGKYGYFLCL